MSKQKTNSKSGFVLQRRPQSYSLTPQQKLFQEAREACGIRKGMSREELVKQMRECIPEYYRKRKEETENNVQRD
jgi:hypothetical protein